MIKSRRDVLNSIDGPSEKSTHVSLWFQKYLNGQPDSQKQESDSSLHSAHILACANIGEPEIYESYFNRWKKRLETMGVNARKASVSGRLSIGLGNESVIETGITLHHTYGVPYIPGSALKGTASSYAHQFLQESVWQKGLEAHETLFGSQEFAGLVVFFDAFPWPGTWHLKPDIITVHHPDYYQESGKPPADWDTPTPIPFLSVTGDFLIALYAPDAPAWADAGYGILNMALEEIGIGAKTASGYGRLHLKEKEKSLEEKLVEDFTQRVQALETNKIPPHINSFYQEWKNLEIADSIKTELAQIILDKAHTNAKFIKRKRDNAWHKDLVAALPPDQKGKYL